MKKGWVVAGAVLGVVALVVIGLLIAGGLLIAARGGYGPHMMMGWYGNPRGMGLVGGALILFLLFAVGAGAVVLLVIGLANQKHRASGGDLTPLDILKKRYAGGEIDRDEFERMKEELK
jgi:putative membrane protein